MWGRFRRALAWLVREGSIDPKDRPKRRREGATSFARHKVGAAGAPVVLEVTDVLDLHTFAPRDVKDVVEAYVEAASRRGITEVRIIHGRGRGVQRRIVRSVLDQHASVVAYRDAPAERGGWGATVVELH